MPTSTSSIEAQGALPVARILRAHGLRGEVKVELFWAGSDSLLVERLVRVTGGDEPSRELAVEAVRRSGRFALVKLSGVGDRDAAEALRGRRLEVARSELPELAPGEYFLVDLIGAEVVGPEGPLGRVSDVSSYPSVDVLVIELRDGRRVEQPLTDQFIERVDARAGLVVLASTDGLIG